MDPKQEQDEQDEQRAPEGVDRSGETSRIQLLKPVTHDAIEYADVVLREPTAGDFIAAEKRGKGPIEQSFWMISIVGRIPFGAVQRLRSRDVERINDELEFLKNV